MFNIYAPCAEIPPPAPTDETPKVSGVIARFGLFFERKGHRKSTVRSAISALKAVAGRKDLLDAGGVKYYLAKAEMEDGGRLCHIT